MRAPSLDEEVQTKMSTLSGEVDKGSIPRGLVWKRQQCLPRYLVCNVVQHLTDPNSLASGGSSQRTCLCHGRAVTFQLWAQGYRTHAKHHSSLLRPRFHKPRKAMAVWIQFSSGVSNKAGGIRKGPQKCHQFLAFVVWGLKKKKKWSFLFVWCAQCTTKLGSWQIMASTNICNLWSTSWRY